MNKDLIKTTFKSASQVFRRNSPTILTGLGVAGLVSTTVMAVRATPKALQILELAREEKKRPLTKMEVVKTAYPYYIPPIILGGATIGCIIGANSINLKRNAALASAYSITEATLKDYKAKVQKTLGEKETQKIKDELAKDKIEGDPLDQHHVFMTGHGDTLCYDAYTGRYFKSDKEQIKRAENQLNRNLLVDDFVSLNEVYDYLGLEGVKLGDDIGWQVAQDNYAIITFIFSSHLASNGVPCMVIDFEIPPSYEYL